MKTTTAVKPLNPLSPDTKMLGNEPVWRVQPVDDRASRLSMAFNWYNHFYGKKDARNMIVRYLETHDRKQDVRTLRGVPDSAIRTTAGWLCRMTQVGLELTDSEQIKLDNMLQEILASKQQVVVAATAESETPRLTIQDRLREKAIDCAGELEGMFDEFVAAGAKMSADYKPIFVIRSLNVAPQMINSISDIWKQHLAEYEAVAEGKDSQLTEAYAHLGRVQIRNCIKFCETVINDCGAYVQIKKVERKPRKAKPVSPEKRAARFKIQPEFVEFKLKSLPAAALVDKTEAWLYDTKKRKLIHVVADEYARVFTVKNNSIIGFSTTGTLQKTVRKPVETIKAMQAAGKPAARKLFKELTTTETVFNGRGTENLVILRVW
jgi:hypothetical protein